MYLTNLREYRCVKRRLSGELEIAVRDIVSLKNDSTKQLFWNLAIVQELLTGEDGGVRATVIKTTNDKKKSRSLRKSIQHLIPIEVRRCEEVVNPPNETSSDEASLSTDEVTSTIRLPRQAATIGELKRRLNKL